MPAGTGNRVTSIWLNRSGFSSSVMGDVQGRSLFRTILYGRPHGSSSKMRINSSQALIFARRIPLLRSDLASL